MTTIQALRCLHPCVDNVRGSLKPIVHIDSVNSTTSHIFRHGPLLLGSFFSHPGGFFENITHVSAMSVGAWHHYSASIVSFRRHQTWINTACGCLAPSFRILLGFSKTSPVLNSRSTVLNTPNTVLHTPASVLQTASTNRKTPNTVLKDPNTVLKPLVSN